MDNCIDRMIINLVTLLISGTGIFKALTKYNVPELRKSYWGENPFAVKGQKIDAVNKWIFTSLAIIGLLFKAFTLIWGQNIPDRNYGAGTYITVFGAGLLVMWIVVFLLTKVGNMIARRKWMPYILMSHRPLYDGAKFIVEHNGRKDNQIGREDLSEKYIKKNYEEVDKNFTQIESLLNIPHDKTDEKERLERLRSYFE